MNIVTHVILSKKIITEIPMIKKTLPLLLAISFSSHAEDYFGVGVYNLHQQNIYKNADAYLRQ